MREIAYTDEARRELVEEAAWHDEHGALSAAPHSCWRSTWREIEAIRKMPFAAPPWSYAPRYRARTLRRLRYRVIYEVTDHAIHVAAIVHTSRDPKHWLDRLR